MKKASIGLIIVCIIFALSANVYADQINGKWHCTANGYKFDLDISQNGETIAGGMKDLSYAKGTMSYIRGKVIGHKVQFVRTLPNRPKWKQTFEGFVFFGQQNGQGMAGTFGKGSNIQEAGWYAIRSQP